MRKDERITATHQPMLHSPEVRGKNYSFLFPFFILLRIKRANPNRRWKQAERKEEEEERPTNGPENLQPIFAAAIVGRRGVPPSRRGGEGGGGSVRHSRRRRKEDGSLSMTAGKKGAGATDASSSSSSSVRSPLAAAAGVLQSMWSSTQSGIPRGQKSGKRVEGKGREGERRRRRRRGSSSKTLGRRLPGREGKEAIPLPLSPPLSFFFQYESSLLPLPSIHAVFGVPPLFSLSYWKCCCFGGRGGQWKRM